MIAAAAPILLAVATKMEPPIDLDVPSNAPDATARAETQAGVAAVARDEAAHAKSGRSELMESKTAAVEP